MAQTAIQRTAYGFGVALDLPYEQAIERAKAALKAEGFGTLTEIDVQATLKEKIGAEFRPYVILGACNPRLAHRALQTELDIGLLLPCNVIVYQAEGGSVVAIMDPEAALGLVDDPAIVPIAREAKQRLQQALGRLQADASAAPD